MKKKKYFITIIICFLISSCLEESAILETDYILPTSGKLLHYFERQGDYVNSNNGFSILNATEVYSNLDNYKILDLREEQKFISGHIFDAINVSPKNILRIVDSMKTTNDILLVSETGQVSAYYTSLLHLYGYDNVYTLNFGMASWNIFFANEWSKINNNTADISGFNNENYPKAEFQSFPTLQFDDSSNDIENIARARINSVLLDQFIVNELPIANVDNYIICFGSKYLYIAPTMAGPLPGYGHAPETAHYYQEPFYYFRSSSFLQTLPANKEIIIYSYAGQYSAFIVAYLKVLGYNARSLEYGASQLIYPRLVWSELINEFVFDNSKIMNYPFEK